jgi:DNA primase
LYNEEIIKPGLDELIFVEGEGDALALMSAGIDNVVEEPLDGTEDRAHG